MSAVHKSIVNFLGEDEAVYFARKKEKAAGEANAGNAGLQRRQDA